MSDFSKTTLRKLTRKGISILGKTLIPAAAGELRFANGETGYAVNDNGTGKVKTFSQVLEMAG
jgi:hypothetical protein